MKIKSTFFKRQYDLNKAELIGQGNFAQVFKIFDNELNDSIAIRRVKKSQADLEDIQKEKLINQQLRKVENENILKIYDIIDQQETVWYITEYCSGGSLWDALNLCKDNKMGQKQSLQCILQVSKGLQELHNHRITHRDLKPENILLKTKYILGRPLPVIKLADFGLSTQKIIMETIAGTKEYIAPEQAKFHNYTNAVDVWSLGIIFDQILHGTPFYSGEDNKQVFNKILKLPFKIRDESIRGPIKELLLSLLKKKPYQRPIIAVIRSTVEKIMEEIQNEAIQKASETQPDKNKKRKSSNQINKTGTDFTKNSSQSKLNSPNSSSKENIITTTSRKVYESGTVEPQESAKLQKTWKSNSGQETTTPTGKQKQNVIKEELSNAAKIIISTSKMQIKPEIKERIVSVGYKQKNQKFTKNKSIVDQIFQPEKKEQRKNEKTPQPKVQTPLKQSVIPPITDKLTIYKNQRKKIIASNIKKEQFKNQIIDINTFKLRSVNSKKGLLEKQLKLQKLIAFLPNTQISHNDFQQIKGNPEQSLSAFKRKLNCLNYFNLTQDYQIRLTKGSEQLPIGRDLCIQQLNSIRSNIKRIFEEQIDNYIDQYVQKVLR